MRIKNFIACFFLLGISLVTFGQNNTAYWQQKADYTMTIDMDVDAHTYKGVQKLVYTNNSPDTLNRVFYHLYFNAFQPGSEMDVRSRSIADPDGRVKDRISKLTPAEIGFIKPNSLTQDGNKLKYKVVGTVLEVALNKPVLPGASTQFDMTWDAQVPIQIRRSGRDNAEGVAYSMTQWYPKLAEYDFQGWHADPYISREFHGVWGDFDVTILIDEKFVVGGTGYLQDDSGKVKKGKKSWHLKAPNVHDFTWAADPDYIHDTYQGPNGVTLNFYYKNNPEIIENWKSLQPKTAALMAYFNEHIGPYPYKQYSVIQGGDGGMEYAMSTLITGERPLGSLVGVTSHEMAHSWFQFLLATNEAKHEWMDEGFTSYISSFAMNQVMEQGSDNPMAGSYRNYIYLAKSGKEQPMSTHADRYEVNMAYGIAAYSKGAVFLSQLGYIIGQDKLKSTIKRYYNTFKFKHPTPNDVIRIAEKESGAELDWYLMDWTQTTNTIDYKVSALTEGDISTISLERIGLMPMPIDLMVTYDDGTQEYFYIPLRMMRMSKSNPYEGVKRTELENWPWANPNYSFATSKGKTVKKVEIDPSGMMADVDPSNNTYTKE